MPGGAGRLLLGAQRLQLLPARVEPLDLGGDLVELGAEAGTTAAARAPARTAVPERPAERARRPGRLSFKEQQELAGMEEAILAAEERRGAVEAALSDPATYQKDGASVGALREELERLGAEVDRLYARWQELEALRSAGS